MAIPVRLERTIHQNWLLWIVEWILKHLLCMIWPSLYASFMFQIKLNRNIKNRVLRQYDYRYSLQPLIYDVLHTEGDFYLGNEDSEPEKSRPKSHRTKNGGTSHQRSKKNKDGKICHRIIFLNISVILFIQSTN